MTDEAKEQEHPPSASRALEALDVCVNVAERGVLLTPVVATKADIALVEIPSMRSGLERVLMSRHPEEGLDALLAAGILDSFLPEIKAMVGFGDGEWRHKDVWKHTKQVVRKSVPRTEVRWAALTLRHRAVGRAEPQQRYGRPGLRPPPRRSGRRHRAPPRARAARRRRPGRTDR